MRLWYCTLLFLLLSLVAWAGVGQAKPPPAHVKKAPTPAKKAQVAQAPTRRIEFLRDIAPILDRSGCSAAACHGKFGGRGGLQLSLLTLSPEDDYAPLVYGGRGRRINFADPEKSLLLLKTTAQVSHGGGERFAVGSPQYNTLLAWIKQGAPFDAHDPRLTSLVLKPAKVVLPKVGKTQPVRAIATYTDGSVRDVTSQTVFQSTNTGVLEVDDAGHVTGKRWGGGAILGRYLGTIAASFFTLPQVRKGPYPNIASTNIIDKLVFDNLKRLNVLPSPKSDDYEFLRRVTLDTLGRLPTPEEITAFVADKTPDKRARLIDKLLDAPEFADLRALRLADMLRVNPQKLGNNGNLADRSADLFYEWIWKNVADNTPWDKFVHDLLMARGSTYQNGPACFYRVETAPNDRMENLSQAFLGVRMSCDRCHKHPFDRWTTDDYWNFAAFMGKVGIRGGKLYDENIVYYNPGAQVVNQSVLGKNKGKVAPATFLGEKAPAKESPDMIQSLADWVVSPRNPFFARATVNRLWSYYFLHGVIDPVDDMRATTPESVPGLLDALANELIADKYDVKRVIRLILNSQTYQLSSVPNASNKLDDRFFSRYMPRSMPAEVLLDIMNQATGGNERFGSFPDQTRAIEASLPIRNEFLTAFGQSHREFLADIDPRLEPNLVQTLEMINSPYVNNKVRGGSVIRDALKQTQTDEDLIRALYLRTFCRPPSPAEIAKALPIMKQAKDRTEAAQDLLWALVSSREFYFNH
ncbi:MAG TPA: DUF1549 domain-containing protein [Chthonomonadaceae bacterium]|nr:DUF1549 domain-containing protein [Chthonomonadaceae bacterium]